MSGRGDRGLLALPHVVEAPKLRQGAIIQIFGCFLLQIQLFREKIAEAANNGTQCVSSRTIPLTETSTCNDVPCPIGKKTQNIAFPLTETNTYNDVSCPAEKKD